jgi:hypothetical protein
MVTIATQRRRFVRRYGPYWEFWSPKANANVRITREYGCTDLAYYLWHLLEADRDVLSIDPGILSVRERIDGRWIRGKSPICAKSRTGATTYYGVAYHSQVSGSRADARVLRGLLAQQAMAARLGSAYAVVTDSLLRPWERLISNWIAMLAYVRDRRVDSRALVDRFWEFALQRRTFSVSELETGIPDIDAQTLRRILYRCVHHGTLHGNFGDVPLSAQTTVWVTETHERPTRAN